MRGGGCFSSTASSYGILAPVHTVSFEIFKISRYLPDEPDEPDDTHPGTLLRCSLGHVICLNNPTSVEEALPRGPDASDVHVSAALHRGGGGAGYTYFK